MARARRRVDDDDGNDDDDDAITVIARARVVTARTDRARVVTARDVIVVVTARVVIARIVLPSTARASTTVVIASRERIDRRPVRMRAARACATARAVTVRTDVPRPPIGPRDILVRVRAAGVNHIDVGAVRDGYAVDVYAGPRDARRTWTPGREYSGEVLDVGRDVRGWAIGDEAYGATAPTSRRGAWAEVAAAPAHAAAKKPKWMTHEEACAIPFAGLTAYRAMIGLSLIHI